MRKRKVLICGPGFSQFSGGIQTHIRNFLEAFKEHETIDISFFPITLGLYNSEAWTSKVKRNIWQVWPLCKKICASDIIHLNSTFDTRSVLRDSLYALLISILKKEAVLQFHGGRPSQIPMFSNIFLKKIISHIFQKYKHILILSTGQRKEFKYFFPSIKTILVKNYINVDKFRKNRWIENKAPVFLFLGRIDETKGIRHILDAVSILNKKQCQYSLNFCGRGPLQEWLKKTIIENNLQINFRGVVAGKEKQEIMNNSDVMLLPTRHNEGMPYSILEAFCYGMPVISTAVGAIPDLVKDGETGFLIGHNDFESLANKMLYFCEHPKMILKMGNMARKAAEKFYSFKNMLEFYGKIYN